MSSAERARKWRERQAEKLSREPPFDPYLDAEREAELWDRVAVPLVQIDESLIEKLDPMELPTADDADRLRRAEDRLPARANLDDE